MQLKFTIVVLAAAVCAAQAGSLEEHNRNKRSAEALVRKATTFVTGLYDKVENAAESAIEKIMNAAEKMEENVLDVANSVLKAVGAEVDLKAITLLVKGNVKSCAASGDIQKQALTIRDNLLSCVSGDIDTVKNMINDVVTLVKNAKNVPKLIDEAAQTCKAQDGEFFSFSRVTRCASALKAAATEGNLADVPGVLITNAARATKLAASIKFGITPCISAKLAHTGVTLTSLAANLGKCVQSGLTSTEGAEVIAKAAPQLAGLQNAFKVAKIVG